ncbi:GntR family transcriptional regulator [Luteolibacter sp. LG18]|uniref:GntR family transcriptional regulator n=1 Tax=Luteolibacter sp. LG18 TaxID=2819286 RepID=UPI002B309AD0|nr:hypothetical protein llg_27950 [Luteolibacter sp. LG18]
MAEIPRKISIHDQLVALLREGILGSRWKNHLSSEAELCREFQVSRVTVRKALAQLAAERWITLGGRGRPHVIHKRPRKPARSEARTIRMLTPYAPASMGSIDYTLHETISEIISASGYRVEIEVHPRLFEDRLPKKLSQLTSLPDTAAWVLFYATEPIQKWFANCGTPVVVAGRVYDGLPLPGIYSDIVAAARHAAGLLHTRGHRDLVYIQANHTSLNDHIAAETVLAEAGRLGIRARVATYETGPETMSRAVRNLLATRPNPTAYLCAAPEMALTLLCHLLASGIKVPAQASVISLWDDNFLAHTHPAIARYHTSGKSLGRHIGRMLLDLMRHGPGKARNIPVTPEFIPGGTLGAVAPKGRAPSP